MSAPRTTKANGKKPVRKTSSSKKPATKKVQPKASPTKAIRAADLAKKFHVNPKRLRQRLRSEGIRAPYDAAAIVKIEKLAKEMAKVS